MFKIFFLRVTINGAKDSINDAHLWVLLPVTTYSTRTEPANKQTGGHWQTNLPTGKQIEHEQTHTHT
jgi:hypothetical protein